MDKTIAVSLSGHDERFRLDEDAYDHLARYLEQAGSHLSDDADRAEVLGDLERSVGDRLVRLAGSGDRLFTAADIDVVLDAIGPVDTGRDPVSDGAAAQPRRRRLRRIRDEQEIAGVCAGLADYAELDVAWVRTGFVVGTLLTAGGLGLVYIAMAFILPVDATRDARP